MSTEIRAQADRLVARLDSLQRETTDRGLRIEDIDIRVDIRSGARFVVREGWILLVGAPVALWGSINHWLPFWAAGAIAVRPGRDNAEPAMRAVVAGTVFVLITYAAQTLLVDRLWGWRAALAYLASLPIAADINFSIRERLVRVRRRARAFLVFRRDPALRDRLMSELASLRDDVRRLDRELGGIDGPSDAVSARA